MKSSTAPDDERSADPDIAGFAALRAEAISEGISQDAPLDVGRFRAAMDSSLGPHALNQLRDLARGVGEALTLAEAAAREVPDGEHRKRIEQIVLLLSSFTMKFHELTSPPL